MRRLVAGLAIVTLLLPAVSPAVTVAQAFPEATEILVVDAGAEPRRELRYTWTDEHEEQVQAVISVGIEAVEGGVRLMRMELPISMTILSRVTDVAEDGRARIAMLFDDIAFGPLDASGGGLGEGDVAADAFAQTMDEATQLLTGIRSWQVMDDRGLVLRSGTELPPGVPTEVEEQLNQASGSIPLLPEEPVGLGARWESTGTTVNQGVTLSVTTETELTAIQGDEITLTMSVRLADGESDIPVTSNPFDVFGLQGTGTTVLDLSGIFPRDLSVELAMTMAGDLPGDAGDVMPVEMAVGIDMTMESTPAD